MFWSQKRPILRNRGLEANRDKTKVMSIYIESIEVMKPLRVVPADPGKHEIGQLPRQHEMRPQLRSNIILGDDG